MRESGAVIVIISSPIEDYWPPEIESKFMFAQKHGRQILLLALDPKHVDRGVLGLGAYCQFSVGASSVDRGAIGLAPGRPGAVTQECSMVASQPADEQHLECCVKRIISVLGHYRLGG
jgi:hypothetical protein